jgi:hypothetical protein
MSISAITQGFIGQRDASFSAAAPTGRLFRSQRCTLLGHSTPAAFGMAVWLVPYERQS